ncbi:MAG TPA: hypothetical protein PKE26_05190 [Kiritimatiellia bacterium]|nr:hypothetical protein [Kiritimatiellia bacterium]HMO98487.1 hypothetical protein [Kiritimatiellia bacterium]
MNSPCEATPPPSPIIEVLRRITDRKEISDSDANLLLDRVFGSVISRRWNWIKSSLQLGARSPDDTSSVTQTINQVIRNEGILIIWEALSSSHAWEKALAAAMSPGVGNPEAAAAMYLKTCADRALLKKLGETNNLMGEVRRRVREALINACFTGSGGKSISMRFYSPPNAYLPFRNLTVEELCRGIRFAPPEGSSSDIECPLPTSSQIADHILMIMEHHKTCLTLDVIVEIVVSGFGLQAISGKSTVELSTPPEYPVAVQAFVNDLQAELESLDETPIAFPPDRKQYAATFAEFLLWQSLPDSTSLSGLYGYESYSAYSGMAKSTVEGRVKTKLIPLIASIAQRYGLDQPECRHARAEAWEILRGRFLKFKPEFVAYTPSLMVEPP